MKQNNYLDSEGESIQRGFYTLKDSFGDIIYFVEESPGTGWTKNIDWLMQTCNSPASELTSVFAKELRRIYDIENHLENLKWSIRFVESKLAPLSAQSKPK